MRPERSEELFYLGFNECQDETMRYLVEKQGMNMNDQLMSGLISHLKTTKEYVSKCDELRTVLLNKINTW